MKIKKNLTFGPDTITLVEGSNTEVASPIIKDIASKILKENKDEKVPLRLIKDIVEQITGEEYSSGAYSGAMRDLVEDSEGKIVNIERGHYIYLADAKSYEINRAIDSLIKDLNKIGIVNVLTADDEDIEAIRKIPKIQSKLEELRIIK